LTRRSGSILPSNLNSSNSVRTDVGIDDLSIYFPKIFLPTTGEFSNSRNIDPAKLIKGIGIERMAIPDAHEDAATMAAMALLDLMKRSDLKPEQIGKIYIGTESAVDEAKAIGTYVIGMLEKIYGIGTFQDCCTVEFKAACIGATFALESLSYWVASEDNDKVGIVVASDVAKYPLQSSGEYTQGAGSVALLVKKNPRLIGLEQIYGSFTRDENDFFRPIGCATAVVNGKHSNSCYLDAMLGAFDSFAMRALKKGVIKPGEGECVTDYINHLLFHIPYPKMVEYASAAIFRHDWRGISRWEEIESEIGIEPKTPEYDSKDAYSKADMNYGRLFAKSRLFQEAFKAKAKDSTAISRNVGNIYTGSIYLGLASLLELQRLKIAERVCFGAYGSGCSALVFSGLVQPHASSVALRNVDTIQKHRKEITLQEYETLHEGKKQESILHPSNEFVLAKIDEQGYRHYEYVS